MIPVYLCGWENSGMTEFFQIPEHGTKRGMVEHAWANGLDPDTQVKLHTTYPAPNSQRTAS
jgi:hypothetical protein